MHMIVLIVGISKKIYGLELNISENFTITIIEIVIFMIKNIIIVEGTITITTQP